jgi:hypothetical protein
MRVEQPLVAPAVDGCLLYRWNVVSRVVFSIDMITHQEVDLGRLKARQINVQSRFTKERREFAQFQRESGSIPAGFLD